MQHRVPDPRILRSQALLQSKRELYGEFYSNKNKRNIFSLHLLIQIHTCCFGKRTNERTNMADSHVFRSSHVIALLLLGIILSAGRLSFEDGFCSTTTPNLKFGMHGQPVEALTAYFILDPAWDNCRHDSKVYRVKGYLR